MKKIQLVVADDHCILREGICLLLDRQDNIEVIAQSSNGEETLRVLRKYHPDVLLLDISMPGMNGLEVISLGLTISPKTRIIILSRYENETYIHKALEAGALGYVVKGAAGIELIEAIQRVHHNKYYLSSQIQREVIHSFVKNHKTEGEVANNNDEQLSSRERQVFSLLIEGYSSTEIADILCISIKTVYKHRASIIRKIGIDNPIKMLQYAITKGIIEPDIWNKPQKF